MPSYYVNDRAQQNGDHEVHKQGCFFLPSDGRYLGEFLSCPAAVEAARKYHGQVNGCYWCSPQCHTL